MSESSEKLIPDKGCVVVRMYRHGLGDCYLLAFGRTKRNDAPYYVLIDCGVHHRQDNGSARLLSVMDDVRRATDGELDLLVITHEHTDHISGFIQKGSPFVTGDLKINDVWFGWVEKPGDKQAQALERKRQDQQKLVEKLNTLIEKAAREREATLDQSASGLRDTAIGYLETYVASLVAFDEFSEDDFLSRQELEHLLDASSGKPSAASAAESQPEEIQINTVEYLDAAWQHASATPGPGMSGASGKRVSRTKLALALIKKMAKGTISYLEPGETRTLPRVNMARAYVLGPPRDESLLKRDLPRKVRGSPHEHQETYIGLDGTSLGSSPVLADSAKDSVSESLSHPFATSIFGGKPIETVRASCLTKNEGKENLSALETVYSRYASLAKDESGTRVQNEWRTIDEDWLGDAGSVALSMNSDTNNTSLVLAFELDRTDAGDVLLFAADAQVGNWLSWRDQDYWHRKRRVTTDDLLKRTLVYKVGHHGSHNATLRRDPRATDEDGEDYGLELMDDMIAMINVDERAVEKQWPVRWKMPYGPLYDRLREKSGRRVLRSDGKLSPLPTGSAAAVEPQSHELEDVPGLSRVSWRHSPESCKFEGTDEDLFYDIQIPYRRNR